MVYRSVLLKEVSRSSNNYVSWGSQEEWSIGLLVSVIKSKSSERLIILELVYVKFEIEIESMPSQFFQRQAVPVLLVAVL